MFSNRSGERVPNVTFHPCNQPIQLYDKPTPTTTTDSLFSGKTVIVFAVPGAFIYPYSTIQLMGYNSYQEVFKANGVDDIICVSVNNGFVLSHWAKKEGAEHIHLLPDAHAEFTRNMGMLVSFEDKGMGQRSWRYSMLVKDSVIDKMFIEKACLEAWPEVSDAETMLEYINPSAAKPERALTLMKMWRAVLSA